MKVRVTFTAENDKPRSMDISEDFLKKAYQILFDCLTLSVSDLNVTDNVVVEKAEIIGD